MNPKFTYEKNEKLEQIDDKIATIISDAVYAYILRKGLLKRSVILDKDSINKNIDK